MARMKNADEDEFESVDATKVYQEYQAAQGRFVKAQSDRTAGRITDQEFKRIASECKAAADAYLAM